MPVIVPADIEVMEGATRPKARFQVLDANDVPIDITSGTISGELYYQSTDGEETTYWKKVLTKAVPLSGIFEWTPTGSEPYKPAAVAIGDGKITMFDGHVKYIDSVGSVTEWFESALHTHVKAMPSEP